MISLDRDAVHTVDKPQFETFAELAVQEVLLDNLRPHVAR